MVKILIVSNGHGEDLIAAHIARQLWQLAPENEYVVLPLVGEGHAYRNLGLPYGLAGQKLPSGGFLYMDGGQFLRDLKGGLLSLTWQQLRVLRRWARTGGKILAVGDIVPLMMAWWSGADYAFVGTAKSDYYWRDEAGWLGGISPLDKYLGSVYYPWEQWLLARPQCRAVLVRDHLTQEGLARRGIACENLGNPMMDGLSPRLDLEDFVCWPYFDPLKVVLLPGSRSPEAENNWLLILAALAGFHPSPLIAIGAIAPGLELEKFTAAINPQQWQSLDPQTLGSISHLDPHCLAWQNHQQLLILSQKAYPESLHWAQAAIALAGTACEQMVGLGKPVVTMTGGGPQFNALFALRQTRLLGPAVSWVASPEQVAQTLRQILADETQKAAIAAQGRHRLGPPGASKRIARRLLAVFDPGQ
jgi:uncharacterized protein (TIGR03492 family)